MSVDQPSGPPPQTPAQAATPAQPAAPEPTATPAQPEVFGPAFSPGPVPVLRKVADGLAKEPWLLAGFGALLVISVTAQTLGSRFMPAGWLLLAVYAITSAGWVATHRSRGGAGDGGPPLAPGAGGHTTRILARGAENGRVTDSGDIDADASSGASRSTIDIAGSKGVQIERSGNIRSGPDAPGRTDRRGRG